MAARMLKVGKCPTEALAVTNRVLVADGSVGRHVAIAVPGGKYFYSVQIVEGMDPKEMAFNAVQRKWLGLSLKQDISVTPITFTEVVGCITVEIDYLKKGTKSQMFDSGLMAAQFTDVFNNSLFVPGQPFLFEHTPASASATSTQFSATVKKMQLLDLRTMKPRPEDAQMGLISTQTQVVFEVTPDSPIVLTGSAKGKSAQRSLINPDWDFSNMGIGGLDAEFQTMFRRAFASRVFPLEVIQKMGMKHVRGILLYGPPGTGKTLMARQIGKMLQGREPKIVNGPEILNKYVGESEANIRKLFEDAEKEQKERGDNSSLHIIIFDEIDAICKTRGSTQGGTGVQDSIVNQLLSKIDGVNSLNNILLIGMTNRIDMLDEALLRPGRLELKIQIGLPNEEGRQQILKIHTAKLRDNQMLDVKVDLHDLAKRTKNMSGAELEGLVRCAVSYATNRCVDVKTLSPDEEKLKNLKVELGDFDMALTEVLPAFGVSQEEFERCLPNGIVQWSPDVADVLEQGKLVTDLIRNSDKTGLVSVLLEGPVQSGKTALASTLALNSGFPLIKMISPENMVGFGDIQKLNAINKVFDDSYKSTMSVVVVDDIERLLDYTPLGQRFSNVILQALMVLLKKTPKQGHKLLILVTTSNKRILDEMNVTEIFSKVMQVRNISEGPQVMKVLTEIRKLDESNTRETFSDEDMRLIAGAMKGSTIQVPVHGPAQSTSPISIGIKKLYLFAEMAKQAESKADEFVNAVYDECSRNILNRY